MFVLASTKWISVEMNFCMYQVEESVPVKRIVYKYNGSGHSSNMLWKTLSKEWERPGDISEPRPTSLCI